MAHRVQLVSLVLLLMPEGRIAYLVVVAATRLRELYYVRLALSASLLLKALH